MKDMNRVKVTVIGVIAALAVNFMGVDKVQAQEFKIQGDLVSSYVWRGFYQTGVSFQPTLGFGIGGFSLTAWGSTDFDGTSSSDGEAAKEIDLTAAYTFGDSGLTLSVASLGGQVREAISILTSKAMKRPTILKRGLPIHFRWRSFRCQ